MAHDAELDRLRAEQDRAYQHKQSAYEAMQSAWERRSAARARLDRAHSDKQQAWENQNSAWTYYQSVRSSNGPRIDSLNAEQESAYQDMRSAFENASAAHDRHDGAAARSYADEGHRYKATSQGCVAERRQLVQEIREARERHETTRPAFQLAKSQFESAKSDHDHAKADHERKREEFKQAKAAFDSASQAFKTRLDEVRAQSQRRKDDNRSIAERAGVPIQYLDNVWVSRQGDVYNIYFGGIGKPDGLGHGHYVMDSSGNVTYRREPFDEHGAQNFESEAAYIQNQRDQGHRGGFGAPVHGWIDGHSVTAAFGWGSREGETLLADDHVDLSTFKQHGNHNHYGSGQGPHDNTKDRFKYTGPGA